MRLLITGATGLVGKRITELCLDKGINVNFLTTRKSKIEHHDNYRGFYWNPSRGEIDEKCLQGVGAIINLAGENIFQPWTKQNKQKILDSRIESLEVLYKVLREHEHEVGQIVSASGIDAYPSSRHKMYYEDEQELNQTFLGQVVQQWEAAAEKFKDLGLRVAKIRIGLVLSNDGGALPQLQRPFKFNIGTALGSGKQWQSWIHIQDLARMFIFVVEQGLTGVYNGIAPNPVTHEDLIKLISRTMGKKLWLPKVPAFVLKMMMGEMSSLVLGSHLIASQKIQKAGFEFYYINLDRAFQSLWQEKTGQ